ncbi:hypothetical protein FIBSPDRAFT_828128 [Athelia psychrophila]|uniref:Uncharacterized protein n=1 Tax=Athelia psychrophila TaxID=1759441 RepID=A0A167U416_9AGAM|nr:hypothetical protein FIBSPDRAFT_879343 [Fibularhizoctonia sp. CBS 109695]KZP19542.1 hypothetical protein FIBSPDRAFT_828128 [Fibularhizoctonia sp. CBS 109695]
MESNSSRHVNNLLHTLRGEQFRHSQNVRKDRTHLGASHVHTGPTLPSYLYHSRPALNENNSASNSASSQVDTSGANGAEAKAGNTKVVAGPIPRSWALQADKQNQPKIQTLETARRIDALSVVLPRLPSSCDLSEPNGTARTPPLTMLCLRLLMHSLSAADFAEDVVPHLPPHLRRAIIRYAAVHEPLSSAQLYALCEPDGHADGELLVMGPKATLRPDHFRKTASGAPGPVDAAWALGAQQLLGDENAAPGDWDSVANERTWDTPLQAFVLYWSFISTPTLLTLPPTLTTLALIALPSPVPIHRLPDVCPLLVTLDLSHNPWLAGDAPPGAYGTTLERTKWGKWARLQVLALRKCRPSKSVVRDVNQGRWNDVEILL